MTCNLTLYFETYVDADSDFASDLEARVTRAIRNEQEMNRKFVMLSYPGDVMSGPNKYLEYVLYVIKFFNEDDLTIFKLKWNHPYTLMNERPDTSNIRFEKNNILNPR